MITEGGKITKLGGCVCWGRSFGERAGSYRLSPLLSLDMDKDDEDVDEDLFTDELPDYLKCPICLCLLKFPYQTPCGHRFCKICILPLFSSRNNVCPKDRTVIDNGNTFPDNAARLQINSLKIKCPKHASGCPWVGELSDKAGHEASCEFFDVPCKHCDEKFSRANLESHVAKCPMRQLPCEYCGQQFRLSDLSPHYPTCPDYPVLCRNKCSVGKVPRKEEEAHYRNECIKEAVECPLAAFGCAELVPRCETAQHLISCAPQRTLNLANTVVQLQKEVKNLSLALSQQQEEHTALTDTLYPCCGQFTWKLEQIHVKVKEAHLRESSEPLMIYSPPFFSHEAGYKMCMCVYPAGDGNQRSSRDFLSVYFVLMKGPYDDILHWPYNMPIRISLLTVRGPPAGRIVKEISPDPNLHYFHRPDRPRNVGYGYPKFIALDKLLAEHSDYVAGDAIFIRCEIFHS